MELNLPMIFLMAHLVTSGLQQYVMTAISKNCDKWLLTFISAATTALLALILLSLAPFPLTYLTTQLQGSQGFILAAMTFIALSAFYAISSYSRLISQESLPSYVAGPLSRLSLVVVVLVAIFGFGEQVKALTLLGIFLSLGSLLSISLRSGRATHERKRYFYGVSAGLASVLLAAAMQLLSKIFLDPQFNIAMPPLVFVLGMNLGTACIAGLIFALKKTQHQNTVATLKSGVIAGLMNFVSFSCLCVALVDMNASVVYPVSSIAFIIPTIILLSIRKEKLKSRTELLPLLLAFASMPLLLL